MKILVAGDFCPRERVANAFAQEDYASVLSDVQNITSQVDYSIVNFECPVVIDNAKPIEKLGPNLSCNKNGVAALVYAGFNCVTLANNHFFDYGEEGVRTTLLTLDEYGIDHVGGGVRLQDASRVLYKEIEGQKLAIVNCCEHEFSIASDSKAGCNPLNPVKQYSAIKDARKNADIVLVIIHGGHELFQLPSPRMVETYRFFIEAGADAVVNHHQHCFSGYEVYQGKPIFYGLGNFCFDSAKHHSGIWTEGYAVVIDFKDKQPSFQLYPYSQCADNQSVSILSDDAYANKLAKLNDIIANSSLLEKTINDYYSSCMGQYSNVLEPWFNRFYMFAKDRGWLPSFVGKKRKLLAADYVICEAHRDKLIYYLER